MRGSILIASLWMISILTVMTGSLGFQARQELLVIKREMDSVRSKADFISALQMANQRLAEDPLPHEDSLHDAWQGKWELDSFWSKRLDVMMEDEESKINLNSAPRAWLETFLKLYEDQNEALQGEPRILVKKILDSRNERRIQSPEELLLLEDVEPGDIEKLLPWITADPEFPQININTAASLVLESLIRSLAGDDLAKEEFVRKFLQFRKDGGVLTQEDLTPEFMLRRLKLTPSPAQQSLLNELLPYIGIDSRYFQLRIHNAEGQNAIARVRENPETGHLEVLSWHED